MSGKSNNKKLRKQLKEGKGTTKRDEIKEGREGWKRARKMTKMITRRKGRKEK